MYLFPSLSSASEFHGGFGATPIVGPTLSCSDAGLGHEYTAAIAPFQSSPCGMTRVLESVPDIAIDRLPRPGDWRKHSELK